MQRVIKASHFNITVVGDFIPTAITPRWLLQEKFISQQDFDAVTIQVVHKDVTQFLVSGFQFQILANQFQVTATDERYFSPLKDLVINIYSVLDRTPITAFGANYNVHFTTKSEDDWHQIGNYLTPKEFWKKSFAKPGMRALTIEGENIFSTEGKGYVHLKVEPSQLIRQGVYAQVNNHFDVVGESYLDKTTFLTDILKSKWNDLVANSKEKIKVLTDMDCK